MWRRRSSDRNRSDTAAPIDPSWRLERLPMAILRPTPLSSVLIEILPPSSRSHEETAMTVHHGAGSSTRHGQCSVEVGATDRIRTVYPVRLVQVYGKSDAGHYAASLAFNTFLSMFPLILGLLAVLGLAIRDTQTQERF